MPEPTLAVLIDNASSCRGQACIRRLQRRWLTIIPVHTRAHASWLNQIEVYFSTVERKVLTPNDKLSRAPYHTAMVLAAYVHWVSLAIYALVACVCFIPHRRTGRVLAGRTPAD